MGKTLKIFISLKAPTPKRFADFACCFCFVVGVVILCVYGFY